MGKVFTSCLYRNNLFVYTFNLFLYKRIFSDFLTQFHPILISLKDFLQKKRSILSNFPLLGRFRFFLESIRPELRQYYWESDDDEVPYSRNQRSMVYQRSKNDGGVRPFGSLEKNFTKMTSFGLITQLHHPKSRMVILELK